MKGKGILAALLAALLCLAAFAAGAEGQPKNTLTIYEGPKTMESSKTASVRVNGYELFVYDVMVNHEHIWNANTQPSDTPVTYFDFSGTVEIDIEPSYNWFGYTGTTAKAIADAIAELGISPTNGDTITDEDSNTATYNGSSWIGSLTTMQPGHGYVYLRQQ